ncbi:MAG: hypothetical protein A2722_02205 [Candidatus Doudnabacteria bacterium RIFCSPHIGHO2_01_FULL_50_11]|uniref:RNA-binding S4 domain-containing protein n=1 Tax=Candidatus Doudnabacteria bacterium RIFCSPHIGHO2_01_FULL_50_11 TaxID=1817828 RepID=A0A1F5PIE2_9BACT|nr:MAG: hypothetical protein A2722_02205 [Candidatus Doudnabacteria bacterium RIFCSPHIGHO2_01_FULL_50_11]HLC45200.1 pseudouridine synthase [Patescibacteria group bacterium]
MTRKEFIADQGAERIDQFLTRQYPEFSRAKIQRAIAKGNIEINGKIVLEKSHVIHSTDHISAVIELPTLIPQPHLDIPIVYEDDSILVIDKPPGIAVHPNPGQKKDSIAGWLLGRYPQLAAVGEGAFRPGIVHRLDADTSGLLVVAKTQGAFKFLKKQFQSRTIEKEYAALIHGALHPTHGVFDQPIGRKTGQARLQAGIGREARTEYWVKKEYRLPRIDGPVSAGGRAGGEIDIFTLVRVLLHTGRTHQIRVHFAAAGHPVAGDLVYGGRFKSRDRLLFPRQFLHAVKLSLPLPGGRKKEFKSQLPQDLQVCLNQLTISRPHDSR